MEQISGGLTDYEKCVLGSATTGAITGAFFGGPVGMLAGWVFTSIGAMAGCAIME